MSALAERARSADEGETNAASESGCEEKSHSPYASTATSASVSPRTRLPELTRTTILPCVRALSATVKSGDNRFSGSNFMVESLGSVVSTQKGTVNAGSEIISTRTSSISSSVVFLRTVGLRAKFP
ncbi:MAG: hypothetical protein ACLUSP_07000 [Christensenellales bacterium]